MATDRERLKEKVRNTPKQVFLSLYLSIALGLLLGVHAVLLSVSMGRSTGKVISVCSDHFGFLYLQRSLPTGQEPCVLCSDCDLCFVAAAGIVCRGSTPARFADHVKRLDTESRSREADSRSLEAVWDFADLRFYLTCDIKSGGCGVCVRALKGKREWSLSNVVLSMSLL